MSNTDYMEPWDPAEVQKFLHLGDENWIGFDSKLSLNNMKIRGYMRRKLQQDNIRDTDNIYCVYFGRSKLKSFCLQLSGKADDVIEKVISSQASLGDTDIGVDVYPDTPKSDVRFFSKKDAAMRFINRIQDKKAYAVDYDRRRYTISPVFEVSMLEYELYNQYSSILGTEQFYNRLYFTNKQVAEKQITAIARKYMLVKLKDHN